MRFRLDQSSRAAGLVLASLLLALLVAEAALRLLGYGEARPGEVTVQDDLLAQRAYSVVVRHESHNASYHYNRYGFRGPDWTEPKLPGKYRIAMLGDSFVFGVGLGENETLPAQLARELAARRRGPIEILNLGMGGTNTQQQAIIATRKLPYIKPDLLILVSTIGDTEALPWNPDPYQTECTALSAGEIADHFLMRHFFFYRPLHAALASDRCTGPQRCALTPFLAATVAARCAVDSLQRIALAASQAGSALLMVFYPTPNVSAAGPPYVPGDDLAAAQLGEIAGRLRVRFAGLIPVFAGRTGPELKIAADQHPNAMAHGLAARALADELDRWWGEPRAAGNQAPGQ